MSFVSQSANSTLYCVLSYGILRTAFLLTFYLLFLVHLFFQKQMIQNFHRRMFEYEISLNICFFGMISVSFVYSVTCLLMSSIWLFSSKILYAFSFAGIPLVNPIAFTPSGSLIKKFNSFAVYSGCLIFLEIPKGMMDCNTYPLLPSVMVGYLEITNF